MKMYIFSQIIVILAYIVLGVGFLKKEKIQILIFSTIFSCLILIQYILLNAYTGILACIINIIRNLLFILNIKRNKENSKAELVVLCTMAILCGIFLYQSLLDICPIVLTVVGIYSYWNKKTKVLRICNIICSLCYMIYAIPINSIVTILCEIYLIVTTIIGIVKYEIYLDNTSKNKSFYKEIEKQKAKIECLKRRNP